MAKALEKHGDKLRFIVVGGTNTALDFLVLFIFVNLGVDKIIANYISTSVALVFSFFANKTFTFKNTSKNAKKQFLIFLAVTLAGLWILQPIIIWLADLVLAPHITNETSLLFVAKMIATVASLIWNYMLYSRLVFKEGK
ncbi:MAG: GtrA family protein [Candidatus Microsaccharimonas sp.]